MDRFQSKAEQYRQRSVELFAMAEGFIDPAARKRMTIVAEEYLAMAKSLDRFAEDGIIPDPPAGAEAGPALKS